MKSHRHEFLSIEALDEAIALAGSKSELARLAGVPRTTVQGWVSSSGRMSLEGALCLRAALKVLRKRDAAAVPKKERMQGKGER
jgi:DNA-binding transcriptional regulator YdaS (Cro superfamily)